MLIMEGNCRLHPDLTSLVENVELYRSNSDASSLTAENCEVCCSAAVKLDDHTAWTDEKHNFYLQNLEMSFVKQLHPSKRLLAQCSEQNQSSTNISLKQLINVNNDSEQFQVLQNGCWKKINCVKDDPSSRSIPADSQTPFKGKGMHNLKHNYVHYPPLSAEMPEFMKLHGTVKHGKVIIRHGLATGKQDFSTNNARHGDLDDLTREGMGQNFLDEEYRSTSIFESPAKRSKTALVDSSSHQDQIVPSTKCPTRDSSVFDTSLHGAESAHHKSV